MDPNTLYQQIVDSGVSPDQAALQVQAKFPGWTPGSPTWSNPTNPADSGSGAPGTTPIKQPTAAPSSSGASGTAPSYVNINDPTQKAVWEAFQKKGLTPRDRGDFDYWVNKINTIGGGWGNEANRNWWIARMDQAQGGVGDYQERPETGGAGGSVDAGLLDPYGGEAPPGFAPPPGSELPGRFSYADFNAPSYEEAFNDPGYQFAVGEGRQALENSAFGKGVGRTGGTLKDLIKYGQAAGATQYQNVFDRKLTGWQANQGNQSGVFGTNLGLAKDVYNRYKGLYELGRDTFTNWQDSAYDKLYKQQNIGVNANQ